jgi:hypothetical protein
MGTGIDSISTIQGPSLLFCDTLKENLALLLSLGIPALSSRHASLSPVSSSGAARRFVSGPRLVCVSTAGTLEPLGLTGKRPLGPGIVIGVCIAER